MAVRGSISNFTSSGRAVSGYRALPAGITQGIRDPATGKIHLKPRPVQNGGVFAGGAVKVINARSLDSSVAKRDSSLGMGGLVGDQTT